MSHDSRALVSSFVNSTYFDLVATAEPGSDLESFMQRRIAKVVLVIPEGYAADIGAGRAKSSTPSSSTGPTPTRPPRCSATPPRSSRRRTKNLLRPRIGTRSSGTVSCARSVSDTSCTCAEPSCCPYSERGCIFPAGGSPAGLAVPEMPCGEAAAVGGCSSGMIKSSRESPYKKKSIGKKIGFWIGATAIVAASVAVLAGLLFMMIKPDLGVITKEGTSRW